MFTYRELKQNHIRGTNNLQIPVTEDNKHILCRETGWVHTLEYIHFVRHVKWYYGNYLAHMQHFLEAERNITLFCFSWILVLMPCSNPLQEQNSLSQTSFGFKQTHLACRLMQFPAPAGVSLLNTFKSHTFTIRVS